MGTSRKTNTNQFPRSAAVMLAAFLLVFGAFFLTIGLWSLVRPEPSLDTIPGAPFVIIGSLTGLYPHQAGVGMMVHRDYGEGYRGNLNEQCVTFGQVLRSAGYQTMLVGKWHAGHAPRSRPEPRLRGSHVGKGAIKAIRLDTNGHEDRRIGCI